MWGTSFLGDSVCSRERSAQRKLKISFSDETHQMDQVTRASDNRSVQVFMYGYQQGELQKKTNHVDILGQPSLEVRFEKEHASLTFDNDKCQICQLSTTFVNCRKPV